MRAKLYVILEKDDAVFRVDPQTIHCAIPPEGLLLHQEIRHKLSRMCEELINDLRNHERGGDTDG